MASRGVVTVASLLESTFYQRNVDKIYKLWDRVIFHNAAGVVRYLSLFPNNVMSPYAEGPA
jgi:hypothetical protein